MTSSITTRFSREAAQWYDKWLEQETYQIEPPKVGIVRLPIVGLRQQGVAEDAELDGPLVLEADPDNKHDPRAIKVMFNNVQIGWVPRKSTALIHNNEFHQEGDDLSVLPKVISGVELFIYLAGV